MFQTDTSSAPTEAAAVTPAAGHWLFPHSGKKATSDIQKLPQMTRLRLLCTLLLASLLRRPGGCCPPNTHLSSRNHGLGSFHPWPSSRRRNCCRDTSTSLLSPSHTTLAISMNYLYYISSFITHTLLGGSLFEMKDNNSHFLKNIKAIALTHIHLYQGP